MTVYAKQYGRTGNNLFQKAAAIGYAEKHGMAYDLRKSGPPSCYHKHVIQEAGHHYQELEFDPEFRNEYAIVLDGYWQSEKYFAHCRGEVLKAFNYKWRPISEEFCSIHVRRGDYLKYPDKHPVVTEDYLDQAIAYMVHNVGINRFMVFSDDIEYCQQLMPAFSANGSTFIYAMNGADTEDLVRMSECRHHIISNSTFSWWGAWLNQNQDKVVISPSKDNWFGPGNVHLDTSDLIPESWIQIKY